MATILELIQSGKYDKHLDQITRAIQYRKEEIAFEMVPGSRARFRRNTRPAYLAGQEVTVIEWRRSRVLVQMDHPTGRFYRGGGRIIAHPGGLEPIAKEVITQEDTP
jgi:hypothetical protein